LHDVVFIAFVDYGILTQLNIAMLLLNKKSITKEFAEFARQTQRIEVSQLKPWELRETLSLFDKTLKDDCNINASIITSIVENVIKNKEYSWADKTLTIYDEANIQKALRKHGYELKCHELNEFPTSTVGLRPYLIKQKIKEAVKFKFFDLQVFYRQFQRACSSPILSCSRLRTRKCRMDTCP
jgi:hypothetical protein